MLFLPPYSSVHFDEAQKYYDSRKSATFPDYVSRLYEAHAHYHLNITMACQRSGLIDLNIRALARYIEVLGLKHKFSRYEKHAAHKTWIVKSTWICREFEDYYETEAYINSGGQDKLGNIVKYEHEGNIFKCYDTCNFFSLFLNGYYDRDFDLIPNSALGLDVESVKEFNNCYAVDPENFRKKKVPDKQEKNPLKGAAK